jgi:flagellar M-ring protein FliF
MNKILDFLKSLGQKWKDLSKGKKTAIIIGTVTFISVIAIILSYTTKVTYAPLFYNLESQDAAAIRDKLIADKVPYKVKDNTILVPKDLVEELRISVYSGGYLPSSGKGFELFDESKFGVTDTEAKVMYQRALETELARTIESLNEVDKARVHLVLPDETVFARETEKATASVTLMLKGTSSLTPEQVKSVIALVSGSVKDLPKENIEVIDSNLNHLSEGLYDETTGSDTMSASKQQQLENEFEAKIQKDVVRMLESVFGTGKVSVNVNTDMDFDSKKISQVKYDKEKIELLLSHSIDYPWVLGQLMWNRVGGVAYYTLKQCELLHLLNMFAIFSRAILNEFVLAKFIS